MPINRLIYDTKSKNIIILNNSNHKTITYHNSAKSFVVIGKHNIVTATHKIYNMLYKKCREGGWFMLRNRDTADFSFSFSAQVKM